MLPFPQPDEAIDVLQGIDESALQHDLIRCSAKRAPVRFLVVCVNDHTRRIATVNARHDLALHLEAEFRGAGGLFFLAFPDFG